jgi:hypothetical protein
MNTAYETLEPEIIVNARRHACLFFSSPNEQMAETLPFIRDGLAAGERCIFVTGDCTRDHWTPALRSLGVDVEAESARGALNLWPASEWRPEGELNSILMARRVWDIIEETQSRFEGLRLAIDMDWTLAPETVPSDQLCHLEATLDYLYTTDLPLQVICQYSRRRLSYSALHAGLRTHSAALTGREAVINPFYDAPAILEQEPDLNHCIEEPQLIEAMIEKLSHLS